MLTLLKNRSNRPITEFACSILEQVILSDIKDAFQSEQKNTTIRFTPDGRVKRFSVNLYEEEILLLVISDEKPVSLRLSFTSFFDGYGQPTSTTAERLNGLLDKLGCLGIIPQGVRLFRDQEYHTTYIGKGDEKVAVGQDLFNSVYIKPDKDRLIFAGYYSSINA